MKKIIKLSSISLCLLLSSCAPYSPKLYMVSSKFIGLEAVSPFNTVCSFTVQNSQKFDNLQTTFEDYIWTYHQLVDIYHDYDGLNNLKTVNDNIGSEIIVDQKLYDMVKAGVNYTKLTKGYFNIALGAVTDLYEGKFQTSEVQTDVDINLINEALTSVPNYTNIDNNIVLNDGNHSIKLINPVGATKNIKINLGGFAKGYVADQTEFDSKLSKENLLVNLGSSSFHAVNKNPNPYRDYYSIAIENPVDKSADYIDRVQLNKGESISTSGDYQNYYLVEEDGQIVKKHHIINPFTGLPLSYHHLVSVKAKINSNNVGLLDALSTALFNIETNNIDSYLNEIGVSCNYIIYDDTLIKN